MCLALSQQSLDREVCPRLRDSNLATTSILWRSSADMLWGSSFLISTKSSSTDFVTSSEIL